MAINSYRRAVILAALALTATLLIPSRLWSLAGTNGDFAVVGCQSLAPHAGPNAPDRVVIKQKLFRGLPVMGAEVEFVSISMSQPKTLRTFQTPYLFNDVFFQPGGILVTEWVAGDRPVTEAFHFGAGGVDMIFNKGARGGFEYWHNVILRTGAAIGSDGNYHSTTTQLWQWDGRQYKLVATVPYNQRLKALAKLQREAKN